MRERLDPPPRRASPSTSPMASSATSMALTPTLVSTGMPQLRAASRSTESVPEPRFRITSRAGKALMSARVVGRPSLWQMMALVSRPCARNVASASEAANSGSNTNGAWIAAYNGSASYGPSWRMWMLSGDGAGSLALRRLCMVIHFCANRGLIRPWAVDRLGGPCPCKTQSGPEHACPTSLERSASAVLRRCSWAMCQ